MAAVRGRSLWGLPGSDMPGLAHLRTAATNIRMQAKRCQSLTYTYRDTPMIKPTPNPPEDPTTSPYESLDSKKLHEAAERALDHYLAPPKTTPTKRSGQLFSVCPDINTEALLANASEDLLSISAIAADLADDVDGSRRSVALAISRVAEGAHLLVERALDHLDEPQMAAILAKQQSGLG